MSFADELKMKSKENDKEAQKRRAEQARIDRVNFCVEHCILAIRYACDSVARNGKCRLDGYIREAIGEWNNSYQLFPQKTKEPFERYLTFKRSEEKQIIDRVRNGVRELGFTNYKIKSYHPYLYMGSDVEFCIEVHIKW